MHQRIFSGGVVFILALLGSGSAHGQAVPNGDEFVVNSYTTSNQFRADVASNARGDFVVVWQSNEQDGSSFGVFGQCYDRAGNAVGGEFQVNTYTTQRQNVSAVAADAYGNFVVTWTSGANQDGSSYGVFGQLFDGFGDPYGDEFQVNTYTTSLQNNSRAAMNDFGDFLVIWQSNDQDGSGIGLFGQCFDPWGNPIGDEVQINTYTTGNQSIPNVAMNRRGDAVVVWESGQDGSSSGIFGQRFDRWGARVGDEFQANTYTTFGQDVPDVAVANNGSFVVVWAAYYQDGDDEGIFAQRFDRWGDKIGGEFQVNTYTTYAQFQPAIEMRPNGEFVVVWQSDRFGYEYYGFTYTYPDVVGQRFDRHGQPVGGEFTINSTTPYYQQDPAIAMDKTGNFVVVWEDVGYFGEGQLDGSGLAVAGQRFGNPPDCSYAFAWPNRLWPPNDKFATVRIRGVWDPDYDPVTITVDSVFQDEPVDSTGDGSTSPDCQGQGQSNGRVQLRRERDGGGNGRVYHVSFTAQDDRGGSCTGEVTVSVPRKFWQHAVDDGPLFDSCAP